MTKLDLDELERLRNAAIGSTVDMNSADPLGKYLIALSERAPALIAAAREAERLREDMKSACETWDGFVDPVMSFVCALPEFEVIEEGGPDASARNHVTAIEKIIDRAEAAEARVKELEAAAQRNWTVTCPYHDGVKSEALAEAERRIKELKKALRPLAALQVPKRPQGTAGAYSIRHCEIEAARAALSPEPQSEQVAPYLTDLMVTPGTVDLCPRCRNTGLLTYDELTRAEKESVGLGSVFPCPCGRTKKPQGEQVARDRMDEVIANPATHIGSKFSDFMEEQAREEQRRNFAYGNAAIDNPNVTRKLVDEVADAEIERLDRAKAKEAGDE